MSWRHWFDRLRPAAPRQTGEEDASAPNYDEDLLERARALRERGDRTGALALLDAALSEAHQPALVHHEMGTILRELPDLPAAEASFSLAVELDSSQGAAWLGLGEIQARFERYAEAQASLERARECAVGKLHLEITLLLAKVLGRRERFIEALTLYRQAMDDEPKCAEAFMGAAVMELRLARDETAIELFDQGLALNPKLKDAAMLDLSSAYRQVGRWQEALQGFESALRRGPVSPTLRWYLSQTRLALCDWARGWDDYGSRFASGAVPYRPLAFRTWEGLPIPNQTLVILAEQGLGDEIMFASCLQDAISRAGHCIIECEPRLAPIFRRSFPELTVLPTRRQEDGSWLDGVREPDWQVFSGDLPRLFRRRDEDFPQHQGYLRADPSRVNYWRERLRRELGEDLKIGISWRGGTPRTRTQSRSVPGSSWRPILEVKGCSFINLQYGDSEAERQGLEAQAGVSIAHYPEALADYDETAALVCALDLVVSVCTAVIHLSGALGRPVWILTPKVPEWRYTANRLSLAWYPSSRVFRQMQSGEWDPACQELAEKLKGLTFLVNAKASGSEAFPEP